MQEENKINSILKDFYKISGTRISIHDIEFNELYSYPNEVLPFCKKIQECSGVLEACKNNDKIAFNRVNKTGQLYIYKCHCGLYEAVAPIYHYGVISGYLMMGQIRDNNQNSLEYIIKKSTQLLNDKQKAVEISSRVKAVERELIYSYVNIMSILSEYITNSNRLFNYNEKLPQLIMEYINKNYHSKITLTTLTDKFRCSSSTLTKCFKNEYNISIMNYVCDLRLRKSEEMLKKTRKSLKEISFECGFYDQNYFSKLFLRKYGCSPSVYRNKKNQVKA